MRSDALYGPGPWSGLHRRQGSVMDVWNSTAPELVDHIAYNAWGGIASQTNPSNAPLFGYNGEYTDPATGMQ